VKCCPACGQTLPEKPLLDGAYFTPHQSRIFEIVVRAGSSGIGSDDLFDALYRDDPDGGPLSGRKSMYTTIGALNRKLAHHGLRLRATPNGRRTAWNYVLDKAEQQ
jgi:hypothetical protein